MRNFFKGLVVGILGALLWIISSIIGSATEVFGGPRGLVYLFKILVLVGFWLIFLGPIIWWILVPTKAKWYPKKYLRIPIIAIIAIFSIVAISASVAFLFETSKSFKTKFERAKTTKLKEGKQAPVPTAKPTPTIGSALTTDGLEITLNNVRKDSGGTLPDYLKPKSGYAFIVINLTVANAGDKPLELFAPLMTMNVIDSNENKYIVRDGPLMPEDIQRSTLWKQIEDLSPGTNKRLSPGQKITGDVWFEISENSTGLKFIYWGGPFEKKLVWELE